MADTKQAQHTPGEFAYDFVGDDGAVSAHFVVYQVGSEKLVATLSPYRGQSFGEVEANARLLAAAPSGYEAAKTSLVALGWAGGNTEPTQTGDAVADLKASQTRLAWLETRGFIAKAEGR